MFRTKTRLFRLDFLVSVAALLFLATLATPQTIDPFENGWTLDAEGSELNFMSIKKGDVAEDSRFATLSGLITEDGKAQIRVLMDSVDTHVDLRNVRMRFLFFESFKYPEALITAQLDPATLQDLHQTRRKMVEVPFTLDLHGVTVERSAEVAVALIDNDRVNVSTTKPIALKLADFNLEEGRQKLQEAAEVTIVPVGMVSFDFVFNRSSPGTPVATAEVTRVAAGGGASAALETKGAFDREACIGRFEILSRAGNIYFGAGSARLSAESVPLLENLYDVVSRCPDLKIEIAGHTDSDGSDAANLRLSELRAASVKEYLQGKGIPESRMLVVGYGEAQPLLENTSAANKARNRRIEFSALN
ncbi:OmpA family protein [Salipiger bermudensis]|uniref:OmpA family protein n=1 Tax=Salipiger bermudensis TaxID=344736 RepID=UPI00300BAA6D